MGRLVWLSANRPWKPPCQTRLLQESNPEVILTLPKRRTRRTPANYADYRPGLSNTLSNPSAAATGELLPLFPNNPGAVINLNGSKVWQLSSQGGWAGKYSTCQSTVTLSCLSEIIQGTNGVRTSPAIILHHDTTLGTCWIEEKRSDHFFKIEREQLGAPRGCVPWLTDESVTSLLSMCST